VSSTTHADKCPIGHTGSDRKTERAGERYQPAIEEVDGTWHLRSQHLVRQALREFGDESVQEGFSAQLIRANTSGMRTPVLYMDGEPHRQVRAKIARYFAPVTVGRRYRDLLRGSWGDADVEDCLAVTRHLAEAGRVDRERCVIRGGSAGGFTALAAVCFQAQRGHPGAFAAACSLYGVTDLASLAADTHKFESRYLDGLVGELPADRAVYRQRSPLHHA